MEEETVLREAITRRDGALAEARRLDEFVRLYNELRGRPQGGAKYGEVVGMQLPPLSVVGDTTRANALSEPLANEFILDKSRPLSR